MDVEPSSPAEPADQHPKRDPSSLLVLINGVIAALAGAYVTTGSIMVTVIVGIVALLIVRMLGKRR